MDLSQIPLDLLKSEHAAVDSMQAQSDYGLTDLCCNYFHGPCTECPVNDACDGLIDDSPGWPERKERYLLALRAEIERRS